MYRLRTIIFGLTALFVAAWAYACGDGTVEPPPPDPPRPTTVTVSPATARLVSLGATVQLSAEVRDQKGNAMTGTAVTWTSSDAAVATVDASGLATAAGEGTAVVTASAGSVSGTAAVTVEQVPAEVVLEPASHAFVALGDTIRLSAEALDANGNVVAGAEVAWSSGDTLVATVDGTGLATAVGEGEAQVTAMSGPASASASVRVTQLIGSVTVSPATDTLVAFGDTLRLVPEAFDANGHPVEGGSFTWASSDGSVARVDGSGLVTAVAEGMAYITATAGEASGTAEITVANPDRAALVALYNATDGPNWLNNENWLTDAPLGQWHGVTTDATGRVQRLHLAGQWDDERREEVRFGLDGPIPLEIGRLSKLEALDLGTNSLSGSIPVAIARLTNLRQLNLSGNNLAGGIPRELGSLTDLTLLSLDANQLTGSIPAELGNLTDVYWLGLRANLLTGMIPSELGNISSMEYLLLSSNQLTGPIPPELGNLVNLWDLDLAGNRLEGPLPHSLVRLTGLEYLSFGNQESLCAPGTTAFVTWIGAIEGRVEGDFCNAADVSALRSIHQATGGAGWTRSGGWMGDGAVEEWEGIVADSLGQVLELHLADNNLTGSLPASILGLSRLEVLRIGDNPVSGRLPRALVNLPIRELHYAGTEVCVPDHGSFRAWLAAVPSHEGTGIVCSGRLSDREILEIFFHATGGSGWSE